MRNTLPAAPLLMALLAAASGLDARAERIFEGKDLTEKNLIEALKPAPSGDAGPRTRSIKVEPSTPSSQTAQDMKASPANDRSAGLLITFTTGSAQLAGQARASLDVVGRALQSRDLAGAKFVVEGHADPRGVPQRNLELSQARAETVANYLSTAHSISLDRLKPVGKGSAELVNRRRPEAPENRRVTLRTLQE